ncbi:DNA primase family protein [Alteriqipengyuania lutimaris]|uniref:DNA primase family protein n=1 Tax=Alteriqipengyuania lutimaris TaxID=1538146 RepID=UPI0015F158EF|nr:phage/plasmid primase, P4 family [Alteriqipengyuania lutimaris]MBB3034039.1 putative DNA primase/helicase [Alteriqipengyuania lutimaris]
MPEPEADLACAHLPLTDLGNAERWRLRHGDDFRFCDVMGWFRWDGRRWKLLSEEKDALPAEVMQSVFHAIRAIRNEANLIAALGCNRPQGLSDAQLETFLEWAGEKQDDAIDAYLRGDEDGSRAQFVRECDVRDFALATAPGKRKLWSDAIAAHAKASETSGKLASVAKLAKSFADIAIRPEQLDQDRMAINVLNGTLRIVPNRVQRSLDEIAQRRAQGERDVSKWKTDGWRIKRFAHDRADLITKLAPVKFSPAATSPVYDAFILRVQPDAAMRRFIHQWGGLSLTGDIGEQKLAFFYGSGRNGKGTWVEAVAHLAGDYAGSIPIESFLDSGIKRRGDQATPDIARLPGVRFLRVSEPEKNARLNEGLIKMVTGGDPVDARHLNKGFFTFLPDFKMTISGNHKPQVKDTSDGIWRRMQLVPWGVTIDASEVDRSLPETLKGEASGILNRLLEGLVDWRAHGLIEPDAVRKATAAYRDQSDDLGRFLSATCEVGEDDPPGRCRVKAKALFDAYCAWADEAGASSWTNKGFKAAMLDKGFEQKTSNGVWWIGIHLRDGVSAQAIRDGDWSGPVDMAAGDAPPRSSADDWVPNEWVPGDD